MTWPGLIGVTIACSALITAIVFLYLHRDASDKPREPPRSMNGKPLAARLHAKHLERARRTWLRRRMVDVRRAVTGNDSRKDLK